jgi:hypothetical protein
VGALWLELLLVVALLVAVVAASGVRARGTRPVGRTRLMSVARVVAILVALVLLYAAWTRPG